MSDILYEQNKNALIRGSINRPGIPPQFISFFQCDLIDLFEAKSSYDYIYDYFESAFSVLPDYDYCISYKILGFEGTKIQLIVWLENNE